MTTNDTFKQRGPLDTRASRRAEEDAARAKADGLPTPEDFATAFVDAGAARRCRAEITRLGGGTLGRTRALAEAEARRVAATQKPVAPVVPIRPRPAVATSPEDARLSQALAVIEGVRSYPVTAAEQRAYSIALPLLPQHSGLVAALADASNAQTDTGASTFTPGAIAAIHAAIQRVRHACGLTETASPDAA